MMIKTESGPETNETSTTEQESADTLGVIRHVVEGMSGFSFVERPLEISSIEVAPEPPAFSLESAETVKDNPLFSNTEAELAPQVGNIPIALCDEELFAELNKIPDRLAFKIGDVADLVDVKTYVLRYWETEFDVLNPKKSKNNQRVYSKRDVENVMLIKKLLYRDRFSIEGARAAMKQLRGQVKKERQIQTSQNRVENAIERMEDIQSEIQRLKQLFQI